MRIAIKWDVCFRLLTLKYSGISSFSQDGSQWAKHFVDSSFWEDVKRAGSSRNSKLVVSGNNALCSGRKNLLACSSVLKAFTKARERERVTRHEHVFIASRRQDKLQNLWWFCLVLRFFQMKKRLCFTVFLWQVYHYIGTDNVWILSLRYHSRSLLSGLRQIRDSSLGSDISQSRSTRCYGNKRYFSFFSTPLLCTQVEMFAKQSLIWSQRALIQKKK